MAARTHSFGVKIQPPRENVNWRLQFDEARQSEPLDLQKWRVVGGGVMSKEQTFEYLVSIQEVLNKTDEKEDDDDDDKMKVILALPSQRGAVPPPRGSSSTSTAFGTEAGPSSTMPHPIVEDAETSRSIARAASPPVGNPEPRRSSARAASPASSGSEFKYADGYISGQEDSVSVKEGDDDDDDDDVQLAIKDAHSFKIFQPDDGEKREPASILILDFDSEEHRPSGMRLHLLGSCSRVSASLFMRVIDSWCMKVEGERSLKLYVRDIKGSWIKLWNHSKEYEVSMRDALIITKFLELAMGSKETSPKKFLDQLVDKIGSRRIEIKKVLLRYYSSVVEKFVLSEKAPKFLRKAAIIRNMGSLLRRKLDTGNLVKEESIPSVQGPSSIGAIKLENSCTPGTLALVTNCRETEEFDPESISEDHVQKEAKKPAMDPTIGSEHCIPESNKIARAGPTTNKRKRVVETDTESDSDSDDHVPLAQRQFLYSETGPSINSATEDEHTENKEELEEPDPTYESRKQDQDSGVCGDSPAAPHFNKDNDSSRWGEGGTTYEGEQEYQDVAEIYGGQADGLGDIDDDDDDDDELGDSAFCAICDDGGDLLLCDGPCMRSFHASKESAAKSDSRCRSLGYKAEEVREMGSWLCPSCVHNQHQCFICGRLGKSDGDDKEVYVCDVALCGRFYHPSCIAKWKKGKKIYSITDEEAFIRDFKRGVEEFCCPAHKCLRCGDGEEEGGTDNSMKLAKCRRCPKAYHKVCLPKSISFESRGTVPIRAWEIGDEDDPMKRLVMYCLDHEIIEHLSTPARNHLQWPKDSSSLKFPPVRKQQKLSKSTSSRQNPVHKDDGKNIHQKRPKGTKGSLTHSSVQKELKVRERSGTLRLHTDLSFSVAARKDKSKSHLLTRDPPVPAVTPLAYPPPKHVNPPKGRELQKKVVKVRPIVKDVLIPVGGQADRVSAIMRQASQNVTLETVKRKLVQPSCYGENRKKTFLHKGELASMLNAIRKAWEKVKNGGSSEDAKLLCPKERFIVMLKNEDMLKVHLAPILHGMRYTSFGRHFTCPDKLREIVNRIYPYIDSGDMIVDFCCGANDFSIILNEKLLSVGKNCHFKNFDIHPPKNDFCFTKGDWLQNPGLGFNEGRKLIMGLNPPFGVRAQLATRFILHALKFRPKLLVLIVPPETMSFSNDYNNHGYDLVWEDRELLKGHAFYLPGSVDDNDRENMTQWNVVPPPLFLWSSRDKIQEHREIAMQCGHIESLKAVPAGVPHRRTPTPTSTREVSGQKAQSDKWTNSGSASESSSSRIQHSSTTSSLVDGGLSQNTLDEPGPCLPPGGGHHSSVQNLSQLHGQTSGEPQASDHAARHQMYIERKGSFQRGSAAPGPPQNNQPHVLQKHRNSGSKHSNLERNPPPHHTQSRPSPQEPLERNPPHHTQSRPSPQEPLERNPQPHHTQSRPSPQEPLERNPPPHHTQSRPSPQEPLERNAPLRHTQSRPPPQEPLAVHLANHLQHLSPRGNPQQWMQPILPIYHRQPNMEPQLFPNPHAGPQFWPGPPQIPNAPPIHGAQQRDFRGHGHADFWQQLPPPPPPPYPGHAMADRRMHPGGPQDPILAQQGVYQRGRPELERRPGGNHFGGWLE